jgi:hypothetical protein
LWGAWNQPTLFRSKCCLQAIMGVTSFVLARPHKGNNALNVPVRCWTQPACTSTRPLLLAPGMNV